MFVVGDAKQRARRQPSRNLAQALQAARLRASDLMGQQVNGKGHNAVINRTVVNQFPGTRRRTVSHAQMRSCCKSHTSQTAAQHLITASKSQDHGRFNRSSTDPIDAKIASKDGASPKIFASVFLQSRTTAQRSDHVEQAMRSNLPCSSPITRSRIKQRPTQNLLHPDWHG